MYYFSKWQIYIFNFLPVATGRVASFFHLKASFKGILIDCFHSVADVMLFIWASLSW